MLAYYFTRSKYQKIVRVVHRKNNLMESVLSLHCMGPGESNSGCRVCSKHLCLLSHLTGPIIVILKKNVILYVNEYELALTNFALKNSSSYF